MAGARESRPRGGDDRQGTLLEGYTLRLHVVRRGQFYSSDHNSAMDPEVWSRFPDELMWTVLEMLPAVKRFQLQVVSPEWRQLLTSASFRKALAAREQQRGGEPADRSMVACVTVMDGVQGASGSTSGRKLNKSQAVLNMDIDLLFLPSTFWESESGADPELPMGAPRFAVMAAADGIVCISGSQRYEPSLSPWCVVNPLTRTWRMLPNVPSPAPVTDYTDFLIHMDAGAVRLFTIRYHPSENEYECELLTSDLAAPPGPGACQWTVASGRFDLGDPDQFGGRRATLQYFVSCQGEHYYYVQDVVLVYAVSPQAGPGGVDHDSLTLVEKAKVDAPDAANRGWFGPSGVCLVVCRGRVFFVGLVDFTRCGVWVLLRDTMEWQQVGVVDRHGLDRLTGFKYATWRFKCILGACAAGHLICFKLNFIDGETSRVTVQVGFNVVTCTWELVSDDEEWLDFSHMFELRPDLFIRE